MGHDDNTWESKYSNLRKKNKIEWCKKKKVFEIAVAWGHFPTGCYVCHSVLDSSFTYILILCALDCYSYREHMSGQMAGLWCTVIGMWMSQQGPAVVL